MIALYIIVLALLGGCQAEKSFDLHLTEATPTQDYTPLENKPLTHALNIAISESKEIDRHTAIRVICNDNRAILLGQSPKVEYADQAEAIVAANPQIESVYNYITIEPPIHKTARIKDMALESKIKKTLRRDSALPANTTVEIENGMIYVIGKYSIPELSAIEDSIKKVEASTPVIPIMTQDNHQLMLSDIDITIPDELQ